MLDESATPIGDDDFSEAHLERLDNERAALVAENEALRQVVEAVRIWTLCPDGREDDQLIDAYGVYCDSKNPP